MLLSATDRSKYLGSLLESLLNQEGVDVGCTVRIDSAQASAAVLETLAQHDLEAFEIGPQVGVPGAYFRLLEFASTSADYFAFADHDDLWDPGKLRAAADALGQIDEQLPALWMCQIEPFGDPVDRQPSLRHRQPLDPSVGNALVQTITPGCAMVWNRALQELLRERLPASGVLMHDAWLYLIAASIGDVLVDQRPLVRYRLHDSNAVGLVPSWRWRGRRLLADARGNGPTLESQAAQALQCFGDLMRPEARQLTETVATGSVWRRVRSVGPKGLRRNEPAENAALRARMLLPARLMNAR